MVKRLPAMQETPVQFLGWEYPLEKGWATHSSILGLSLVSQTVKPSSCNAGDPGSTPRSLPGKFHGMRSLVAPWGSTIHGVRESDTTE